MGELVSLVYKTVDFLVFRCLGYKPYPQIWDNLSMPVFFTLCGLLILFSNTSSSTNELVLNIQNTMANPDQASLFYMDTPETLNTLSNGFNLQSIPNFTLSNDIQTASYILTNYLSILNSVGNLTNASQCCEYDYQILDQYCANVLYENYSALSFCSNLNPNFGYTHCTGCLDCASGGSFCPQSPRILYNPLNPDMFSVPKLGPLEVHTSYIDEYLLILSTADRQTFFDNYLMGVTTNLEDPLLGSSECLCCSEFVTFTNVNESSGTCSDALTSTGSCNLPGIGRIYPETSVFPSRVTLWYNNQIEPLIAVGLRYLHEYQLFNLWQTYNLNDPVPTITISNHPFNSAGSTVNNFEDILSNALICSICFVFGVAFVASSFIIFPVEERNNKSKFLQYISGLHSTSYWIGNLLVDAGVAFIVIILIFVPFTFFTNLPFFGSNLAIVLELQVSFIFTSVALAYVASFFFDSPLIAYAFLVVFHFIIYFILTIIVVVLSFTLDDERISNILQYVFVLFPSFAFGSGIYNLYTNQERLTLCSNSPYTLDICRNTLGLTVVEDLYTFETPGILENIVALVVIGIILIILVPVIDNRSVVNKLLSKIISSNSQPIVSENEDSDVSEEKYRIAIGKDVKDNALFIRNLSKVFRGNPLLGTKTKHAVKNLSIGMNYGECFGLLGVNGAGKTTTFEMLTGNLASTTGTAKIHGFDIKTQLQQVRQKVGYCPQFDALQGYLDAYQLLTLYARIRGVPERLIGEVIRAEIERMDLIWHAKFQCGTYSGGNKRKLSTAAALIGNAPVVLLDEPTTGMDPGARRFFWEVMHSITKSGRCIVLTTHSMEECEALCTRLAIMVNGEFKCLGSVQYLKNKFGDGYTLYLRVKEVRDHDEQAKLVSDVKEFISTTFPKSQLLSEHTIALDYQLTDANQLYSEVFEILEKNQKRLNITDYGVSQTTLEHIFLNFAKHQLVDERL